MEGPFTHLSVDVLGSYTVQASHGSRSLVKIYLLVAVCISTGLLCHNLLDNVTFTGIVRGLWLFQMRNHNQISHPHTDRGLYFMKLGSLATVATDKECQGEYMRLFIMLKSL